MTPDVRLINEHIVIGTTMPEQITYVIPNAKQAGDYVAVPHTLEVSHALTNMGFKVPSPIRTEYTWTGRYTPRYYQIATAEAMTLNKRFFCLNSPRTGKTMSTLWAADYLKTKGLVQSVLIIAPLSTLDPVWAQEIFCSFPQRTFAVLHGSRKKRLELLSQKFDFYIINPDGVEIVAEVLRKRTDINMVVIDEVAELSNSQTARWKVLKSLIRPDMWVWGLTGTPTAQSPLQAYGQCKLVRPENYNASFTRFKMDTMYQVTQFKWVPRPGAENLVHKVLSPSIRFTRDVVTDMEPVHIYRHAELSAHQATLYKKVLKESMAEINGQVITAVNAGVLLNKLVQISSGVVYATDGDRCEIDFGPRLKVLEEAIAENDEKVLVFVPFTGVLDALKRELSKKWACEIVDGRTSKTQRDRIFMDFQNKKDPHILIAHPQTMAHGLRLDKASLVIWYAPFTSNNLYQQANCRIDGAGQTIKQDILHLYATREEKRIYDVLNERGRLQDIVLDMAKNNS